MIQTSLTLGSSALSAKSECDTSCEALTLLPMPMPMPLLRVSAFSGFLSPPPLHRVPMLRARLCLHKAQRWRRATTESRCCHHHRKKGREQKQAMRNVIKYSCPPPPPPPPLLPPSSSSSSFCYKYSNAHSTHPPTRPNIRRLILPLFFPPMAKGSFPALPCVAVRECTVFNGVGRYADLSFCECARVASHNCALSGSINDCRHRRRRRCFFFLFFATTTDYYLFPF